MPFDVQKRCLPSRAAAGPKSLRGQNQAGRPSELTRTPMKTDLNPRSLTGLMGADSARDQSGSCLSCGCPQNIRSGVALDARTLTMQMSSPTAPILASLLDESACSQQRNRRGAKPADA